MNQLSGFLLVLYYVLVYGTWIGATLFVLGYGVLSRWYRTEQGRHIFTYSAAVSLAMTLITMRLFFGDFPGRGAASLVCLVLLFAAVWWRLALWLKDYWGNRPGKGMRRV